ncbi:MAG: MafI family immunity protein [Polyangiaceae bacterium]|nr:MafI family immunity protein [Polyangiaceae bacterium]
MDEPAEVAEAEMLRVLDAARGVLPESQVAEMTDLVRAGEPGVALEILCAQLEEHDATLPPGVLLELEAAAERMEIHLSPWIVRELRRGGRADP